MHPLSRYYPNWSLEHEFLLHSLGRQWPENSLALQTTAPQLDWQRLFEVASPDLIAFLGFKIRENGLIRQCPPQLLLEADHARRATAARWLRLRFELRNLASQLKREGVVFVVLKGALLAFNAYPDSSLRSVSDVDLLVRAEGLAQTMRLIDEAGFRCPERHEYAHPRFLKEFVVPGEEISIPLEKPGTPALIEVHTQLDSTEPWFPVPIETVWEHVEEVDWNDIKIPVLDPHEFLFHLVLHLSRGHFFSLGLRPLLDVHLWVELQEKRLDWERIAEECVRRRYGDWMYLTLKMVSDCFSTPIPQEFFARLEAPLQIERLQVLAYEQIWADHRAQSVVPPRLAITFSQPSAGRAISSLFRRMGPEASFEGSTIPARNTSKNARRFKSLRRVFHELRFKVPQYLRAWRGGSLALSSVRRAARLVRGQEEIRSILMTQERPREEQSKVVNL